MMLPNGDRAIVEDAKLMEYVLSPDHPVGKHHAILFKDLLGIGPLQAPVLKAILLNAARDQPATLGQASPYGKKYEQRLTMSGPKGD